MGNRLQKIFFASIFIISIIIIDARAQGVDASSPDGRNSAIKTQDLPETMRETLAKHRLKNEEKQYRDLLSRGEEAAKLGDELKSTLETNQRLTGDDLKKLDRLEKIVKRIRTDLGGEDEKNASTVEGENKQPSNISVAIQTIREKSAALLSEIKKIGRHTISVIAIESSNSLLKLVQYLRFNKN